MKCDMLQIIFNLKTDMMKLKLIYSMVLLSGFVFAGSNVLYGQDYQNPNQSGKKDTKDSRMNQGGLNMQDSSSWRNQNKSGYDYMKDSAKMDKEGKIKKKYKKDSNIQDYNKMQDTSKMHKNFKKDSRSKSGYDNMKDSSGMYRTPNSNQSGYAFMQDTAKKLHQKLHQYPNRELNNHGGIDNMKDTLMKDTSKMYHHPNMKHDDDYKNMLDSTPKKDTLNKKKDMIWEKNEKLQKNSPMK